MNDVQQHKKMTLPTSKNGAHSKQYEIWLLAQSYDTVDHASFVYVILFQEGNFDLCLQSLAHIVPWMFALYQTHYHRWLSVHIRDMMNLLVNHPNIRA